MRWVLVFIMALCSGAAECRPRGAPLINQISYNIVTDGGATCNGDKQTATVTISTPPPFSGNLTVFANQFGSGDVNKAIKIPGVGNGGGDYNGKITSVGTFNGTSQLVTVSPNMGTQVTSASKSITYGSDDAPAFKAFNVWAQANQGSNQVVLTIPNGSVCWIGTVQNISQPIAGLFYANYFFSGINNLIVEGTGATIDSVNGAGLNWGALGQIEEGLASANGRSARIQSASANATTVTLTSASFSAGYISRFSVGAPVMLSGLDIQTGYNENYGVPSNHQFVNYAVVTAICNNTAGCPGTATITFDKPLTWALLATWPQYFAGGTGTLDQGGPATIYALHPFWNATVEYRGLTIADDYQSYAKIRNVTFRNVTWNSTNGTVPSNNENFSAINSVLNIPSSPGWEVDKLVTNVTLTNFTGTAGGVVSRIDFQSSSVDKLTMTGSNIGSMFGTPKSAQITDTHFDLFRPGAWTNGASTGSLVCTRCDATSFQVNGGVSQSFVSGVYSMSGGVVTMPNAVDTSGNGPPHRVFVPGGNLFYVTTGYGSVGIVQNTAQTQDATNVYAQTNQAGGFPGIAGYSPAWRVQPHPQFTCDACTGDPLMVASNIQQGATPLTPMATYGKRSYNPTAPGVQIGQIRSTGKLVSLTVDVTTAFAGTGSPTLNPTGQFHNFTVNQATWADFDWFPTINLKQAGKRVITPGGVTCDTGGGPISGGCSGDTINSTNGFPPNAVWVQSSIDPWTAGSFTGMTISPQFTITIQTDQTP